MINNALRLPGAPGMGEYPDGPLRQMIQEGWAGVDSIKQRRAALPGRYQAQYRSLVTQTVYRSRYGTEDAPRVEYTLPNTFTDMVKRAKKPGGDTG